MEQNQDLTTGKLLSLKQATQVQNMLDTQAFENLIHETSPEVVYDILTAFKDTLKECIGRLEQNEKLSAEDAYKVCHKLKGSALLIGFRPLGDACVSAMAATKRSGVSLPHATTTEVLRMAKAVQTLVLKNI